MKVVVASPQDRARFDAAVAASPLADVLQSWAWGEVKAATGWDAMRLIVEDDDGAVRGTCSILRAAPVRGIPPLLYAPRGPVIDPNDTEAMRALFAEIKRRAGGAFVFKCDPPVDPAATGALTSVGLRVVHGGAFGGVQPHAVMVLDLSAGAEKVFEGFKSKWRYNVRLAERRGVVVRQGARADLDTFHAIYVETAKRDGFTPRGRRYFDALWDALEPHDLLRMFVAEYEGRAIASIICTAIGERVIYNYGASSNEHRGVMPNHLLQWGAIRWAADAGYKVYDFRGVSPMRDGKPVEESIAGLNRFKEGFGARYVEYAGEFDLPLRAGWYALWLRGAPTALRILRRVRGGGSAPEGGD